MSETEYRALGRSYKQVETKKSDKSDCHVCAFLGRHSKKGGCIILRPLMEPFCTIGYHWEEVNEKN